MELYWTNAVVVPLLKSGKDPIMVYSNHIISLTLCVVKLMERLENNRLTWRLKKFGLLNHRKYFRPKRSTVGALLYFVNNIDQGFVKRKVTITIMIDFERAFARVPYRSILLQCL